jgi:hypothetical protein
MKSLAIVYYRHIKEVEARCKEIIAIPELQEARVDNKLFPIWKFIRVPYFGILYRLWRFGEYGEHRTLSNPRRLI